MADMQQAQRFAVGLTPLPTAARVTRARRVLRWRIISTIVSLGLLGVFWYLFGREWSRGWTVAFVTLSVVSSAFWMTMAVVGLSRAKRDLARISDGVAFLFDPVGIEFVQPAQARVRWEDVSALKLAGRTFGAGPSVVVESDGRAAAKVPLSFLDATAEVIDSAARAYSLGRVHLNTEALDNLI